MSEIYSKTAKGQEEIKTRAGGLTQRLRQIRIFIDGKRSRDELHAMLKGEDVDDLLRSLVTQGFAEVTGGATSIAKPAAAAPARPAAPATPPAASKPTAKAPEAPKLSPEELEKRQREEERQAELAMARSFMGKMS